MISTEGILLEEMSWGKNFEAVWNDACAENKRKTRETWNQYVITCKGTNITRINPHFLNKFIFVFSKFGCNRGPWAHRESFYWTMNVCENMVRFMVWIINKASKRVKVFLHVSYLSGKIYGCTTRLYLEVWLVSLLYARLRYHYGLERCPNRSSLSSLMD